MMVFVTTGWKPGNPYRKESPSLAGAQMYSDDALEKHFFDVITTDTETGKTYTPKELDTLLGGKTGGSGEKK